MIKQIQKTWTVLNDTLLVYREDTLGETGNSTKIYELRKADGGFWEFVEYEAEGQYRHIGYGEFLSVFYHFATATGGNDYEMSMLSFELDGGRE